MHLIDHGDFDISSGVRVLVLKGRRKDSADPSRVVTRVSYRARQFKRIIDEFVAISGPNERIYATAAPRDLTKAARRFREMQLQAEYDQDKNAFYRNLEARWASALMQPTSQMGKVWMFDIDSQDDRGHLDAELADLDFVNVLHRYATKNGWHYLVRPFNKMLLTPASREMLSDNALALMGY